MSSQAASTVSLPVGDVPTIDCTPCGAEGELYRAGQSWSCELAALVNQLLTNPDRGVIADELLPVARALKSMKRPNRGLTWIRQRHVTDLLNELAVSKSITHELLDDLPGADRTRNGLSRSSLPPLFDKERIGVAVDPAELGVEGHRPPS